jgi:hypothetical protein
MVVTVEYPNRIAPGDVSVYDSPVRDNIVIDPHSGYGPFMMQSAADPWQAPQFWNLDTQLRAEGDLFCLVPGLAQGKSVSLMTPYDVTRPAPEGTEGGGTVLDLGFRYYKHDAETDVMELAGEVVLCVMQL